MAKTSCITHPPKQQLSILRQDYIAVCQEAGKGKRPLCSALLLNEFEYWTNIKLGAISDYERELSENNTSGTKHPKPTTWIFFSERALANNQLQKLFGVSLVSECLDWLVKAGYLETRKNPETKVDRTKQFRLNITKTQEAIVKYNEWAIVKNNETIPKTSVSSKSFKDSSETKETVSEGAENSDDSKQEGTTLEPIKAQVVKTEERETVPLSKLVDEHREKISAAAPPPRKFGKCEAQRTIIQHSEIPPDENPRLHSVIGRKCVNCGADTTTMYQYSNGSILLCEQCFGKVPPAVPVNGSVSIDTDSRVREKPANWYDHGDLIKAIGEVFQAYNGEANRILTLLRGTAKKGEWKENRLPKDAPVDADELREWFKWFKANRDYSMVKQPMKIHSEIVHWRLQKKGKPAKTEKAYNPATDEAYQNGE